MKPSVAIVGGDPLALECCSALRRRGADVLHLRPDRLLETAMSVTPERVEIAGRPIGGILWRASFHPASVADFAAEDRGFALSELSAALLAATQHRSVLAINRLDAEAWFEEGAWAMWWRRLRDAGVAVCDLRVGDVDGGRWWRPYLGGPDRPLPARPVRRVLGPALAAASATGAALCVCGAPVEASAPPAVHEAARVLDRWGVALAAISYIDTGAVVKISHDPAVDRQALRPVTARLLERYLDHLRHR